MSDCRFSNVHWYKFSNTIPPPQKKPTHTISDDTIEDKNFITQAILDGGNTSVASRLDLDFFVLGLLSPPGPAFSWSADSVSSFCSSSGETASVFLALARVSGWNRDPYNDYQFFISWTTDINHTFSTQYWFTTLPNTLLYDFLYFYFNGK